MSEPASAAVNKIATGIEHLYIVVPFGLGSGRTIYRLAVEGDSANWISLTAEADRTCKIYAGDYTYNFKSVVAARDFLFLLDIFWNYDAETQLGLCEETSLLTADGEAMLLAMLAKLGGSSHG